MKISEFLRKKRIDKGLTQQEVADLIGVSNREIGFYELGIRVPSSNRLILLSKALDFNLNDLKVVEFS